MAKRLIDEIEEIVGTDKMNQIRGRIVRNLAPMYVLDALFHVFQPTAKPQTTDWSNIPPDLRPLVDKVRTRAQARDIIQKLKTSFPHEFETDPFLQAKLEEFTKILENRVSGTDE